MSAEVRRRAAENAFQRAKQAGYIIEQDQRFHTWIKEWISGQMTMPEVAMRYRAMVNERSAARRAGMAPYIPEPSQQAETAIGRGPEQLFDLETEISRVMDEKYR